MKKTLLTVFFCLGLGMVALADEIPSPIFPPNPWEDLPPSVPPPPPPGPAPSGPGCDVAPELCH